MAELTKEAKLRIEIEKQAKDKLREFKAAGPKAQKDDKEENNWAVFDQNIAYSEKNYESDGSMTESEDDD
jgi:hypothetical protein